MKLIPTIFLLLVGLARCSNLQQGSDKNSEGEIRVFHNYNENAGDMYFYVDFNEDSLSTIDLFIWAEQHETKMFARVELSGNFKSNGSVYEFDIVDVPYSSVKLNNGSEFPYPLDQKPQLSITKNLDSLNIANISQPLLKMSSHADLLNLSNKQLKWEGESINF